MLNIIKALQIFWNSSSVKPKLTLAFLLRYVVQYLSIHLIFRVPDLACLFFFPSEGYVAV